MFQKYLVELSTYLVLHGIVQKSEEVDQENYQEFVKQFQSKHHLNVTGLTNVDTLWELQYPFVIEKPCYHITTIDVDTDTHVDCLKNFDLRNDICPAFSAAMAEVHQKCGKIFSSGSLRSLNAEVTPARSHTSLHYTGIALDLCINAGFTNPQTDPYVVVRERFDYDTDNWKPTDFYFKIYFRSPQGTKQKLKAIYWKNHKTGVDLFQEVEDNFICLTEIMQKHGFSTIPPRSGFLSDINRDYLSSEWWHFNHLCNITRGFSLFGIELIKTFGLDKVEHSPVWNSRKAVFNYAGFMMENYIDPNS
ncbi:MAG: hypothetical protein ACRCV0_01620 [Brevinema sp.]